MAVPPPTGLILTGNVLTWTAPADASNVVAYEVYDGATLIGTVPAKGPWTVSTLSAKQYWKGAAYGNGNFLAVASTATGTLSSNGGRTWTAQTLPTTTNWWAAVGYDYGTFVIAGYRTRQVATSTTGLTGSWTSRTTAISTYADWSNVASGDGKFVLISNGDGNSGTIRRSAVSSDNGVSWTAASNLTANMDWQGIAYGNGKFVACAVTAGSGNVLSSPDGVTWTAATGVTSFTWRAIAYGNGIFVMLRYLTAGSTEYRTSTDGITWSTAKTLPVTGRWVDLVFANGMFTALSDNSTTTLSSTDGETWTSDTLPFAGGSMITSSPSTKVALGISSSQQGAYYDLANALTFTTADGTGSYTVKSRDPQGNLSVASNVAGVASPAVWRVYSGGQWITASSVKAWNGTAWQPMKVYDGTKWISTP